MHKRKQGCLLPLDFYNKFKINNKVISYASLNPRVEPRLQEIYRKFTKKLTQYEDELRDNFNISDKFEPDQARNDIVRRKERQDKMDALRT